MKKNGPAAELPHRQFDYRQRQFAAWVSAHELWWPKRKDPSVWGRFAELAQSGRYTFSHVNQPNRHFAETLVASTLEREGYVCWTHARILRKPGRDHRGIMGLNTRLIEGLLQSSVGFLPQRLYEREYEKRGLRLKSMDVIGYNCKRNHWVFAEAKKGDDPLHPQQEAGLRFMRSLFPPARADVFVALVQLAEHKPGRAHSS